MYRQLSGRGQQVKCTLVSHSAVELSYRLGEFRLRRYRTKQRHRGLEFQVVRIAEDVPDRAAFDGVDEAMHSRSRNPNTS